MEEEREKEEQGVGEEEKELAEAVEEEKAEEVGGEVEGVSEGEVVSEEGEEVVEEGAVEAEGEEMPVPVEGEEAKPPSREEKEVEEEIVEERVYTIPLGKCWIVPANRRASRAMRMIRSFVVRHMKLEARGEKVEEEEEEEEVKRLVISNEVNERVWARGVEKPPRRIRVRAAKDKDGNVTVYLAEGD